MVPLLATTLALFALWIAATVAGSCLLAVAAFVACYVTAAAALVYASLIPNPKGP